MQEEKDLQGHSIQPLYVPSTQYCNAFHEAKNEKDFQPLTARGQGSATSKPPMGSRNIATYFACTMSVVRWPAYRRKRALQPFPEPGFVCGRVRNSEADRVPEAEARWAPVGSLNLAPACLLDSPPRPIAECPKATPSCVLPPVTVCYP